MARRLGATEEWIAAVRPETPEREGAGTGSQEGLNPGWTAALKYAELVTQSGHAVGDRDYEGLLRYWSDANILEITLVAGLFSYFNRVNDALRVEVTK